MGAFTVRVQAESFDAAAEMQALAGDPACGALVSFVGLVRDYGDNANIAALELEHYPGMTEKALQTLLDDARRRWPLGGATIIHRIGYLALGEPIVLVVTASGHRADAFAACEYLMDYLKTEAPFWKKEIMRDGRSDWVAAKDSDNAAVTRWE